MERGKKQTILLVHNYYQIPGGEDTVVANEKKLLELHGHKVIVYSRHNSELKNMPWPAIFLLPWLTIFNPKTYMDIKRIIRQENIEIVHVHNTLNLISPAVYYAALSEGAAVVQTIHNFRMLCPGATFYRDGAICEDCVQKGLLCAVRHGCYRGSRIQTLILVISMKLHRATGIYRKIHYICLTKFNREKLLSLKQIKPERVFVKPNSVEESQEFLAGREREEQFIFAGRLEKLKGIDILLEAWKEMGESAPKLVVCGTGPMEEWCKAFVENNQMNVEMRGFVPNREVKKIVAESQALILPTQWYEGFPVSMVEAFSVGTPVIGSDLGNTGSILVDGVNGVKFVSDSREDLIRAVMGMSRNKKMYESTYHTYLTEYTAERNYAELVEIYRGVMRGG